MSTLLFAQNRSPVPEDQGHVRSTVTVVNDDAPSAVETAAPGYNDAKTDPDTDGGLTTHELASHVVASEQYPPLIGNANTDFAAPINDQISTAGTAAAREAAGEWGHGTFKVVQGIEPAIVDGHQLSSDYFAANARPDAGTASYLTPAQVADPTTVADSQATATSASRQATTASMYQAMLDGMMKGTP